MLYRGTVDMTGGRDGFAPNEPGTTVAGLLPLQGQ